MSHAASELWGRKFAIRSVGDYNEEMMQIRERLQLQAHNAPGPTKAFSGLKPPFFPASFIQLVLRWG